MQLILDLLLSNSGILGTISPKNGDKSLPKNGYQQHNQPPLYFSNPDLLWAAGYHLPRLGQGGFQHALAGVWSRLTQGARLRRKVLGKPSYLTYAFAEKRLKEYRRHLIHQSAGKEEEEEIEPENTKQLPHLRRVYMIGDNPESDIKGANDYRSPDGTDWVSVLVKTGVFQDGYDLDTKPELRPDVIIDDVRNAVDWALQDAGYQGRWIEQNLSTGDDGQGG